MLSEIEQRRAEINKTADNNIRAIAFDLDGVLVDAADWHKDALNAALIEHGLNAISEEDHISKFNGLSTLKKLEMLGVSITLASKIYDTKQSKTVEIIEKNCKKNPRVSAAVNYANVIQDTNIAVVTNCSRHTAELMLKRAGFLECDFKFLICNEDVDRLIKPSPWPYMLAAQKLGIETNQLLAIDDTWKGISSAINAGCRTWWIKSFEELDYTNLVKKLDSYRITI